MTRWYLTPSPARWAKATAALLMCGLVLAGGAAHAGVSVSAPAPDFTLRTLAGSNMRLQEQRGKVVMINFWATWCGPCRQEMPHLNKLHEKYAKSGFVLMGVNVDDDVRNAADLAGKLGVKFPVLLDTEKTVSRNYDMSTMPSTLLIDREGRVRHLHRGYRSGYETTYEQQIRDLLKE
jgi:peroxiredoxin